MKRFATSITALAVAGAMSLSVLPAAQAQNAGSSFSYSIEGIAGSLQQFAKLSPELQAEIRAAIEAQDLLKLVQLKLRVDAELAAQQAAAEGKTGAEAEVKVPAVSSPAGSSALASVVTDGASGNKQQTGQANGQAQAGSSASNTVDKIVNGSSTTTKDTTTNDTTTDANANAKAEAGSSVSNTVDKIVNGSSTTAEGTETTDKKETGSSVNLLGNIDARTILGITGVTLAVLSFGGLLSSDGAGSSEGSSAKEEKKQEETKKEETKKEEKKTEETKKEEVKQEARGAVEAESKGVQAKQDNVAGKKRGVLAATGESMTVPALAGLLLALVAAAGFVARRKFAAK